MESTKRNKIAILAVILCLLLSFTATFLGLNSSKFAFAASGDDVISYDKNVDEISQELFGNMGIKTKEYLYNFDDSPDYIYIDFENYGYAVYLRETLELLVVCRFRT